ncbi:MAG: O-antigen ligase family protein [Candidatus Shapirobacteria bacterium]
MKSISAAIEFLFLSLFFITPLIFTSFNSELFELPKMYFVITLTIIITSLHLINHIKNKVPLFKRTFLDIPLLLFSLSQIISTIFSIDPHTSFYGYYSRLNGGLLSIICYLILYWVLIIYLDKSFKTKLINFFLISGALVAAFGIAQHFGIDKDQWVQDVQSRIFSTLGQPNWLAAYLCILLPFSIYKSLESFSQKKYFLSTIYNIASIAYFVALLFTKSKSGLAATIISLTIFFVFNFIKNKNYRKLLILNFSLLIILSLLINNPIKDQIFKQKQISSSTINNLSSNILITPSEDIRKIVWQGAFDLWKRYPIFGTGVETFAYSYYWTRPLSHNLTSEWDFLYNKAHNEYLNYLATTGAVGLITYLVFIFFTLFILFKKQEIPALIAFISILITNAAGFSVVTTSLFFFLLPAFAFSKNDDQKEIIKAFKFKKIGYSLIIIFSFIFLKNTLFYYLADITYTQSQNSDSRQNYQLAYQYSASSLNYRPNEPLYLDQTALIAAKLAIITKSSNYIDIAINNSNKAIQISPANTNLWKERAQIYYYLSSIDIKYFETSINSLNQAIKLAPTDPKNYYLIGQFLESTKLTKEAIPYYQKAIELKSNYDHAYFALGKIYLDQKDYPNATKNFEAALKINSKNTEAQDYLKQIKASH